MKLIRTIVAAGILLTTALPAEAGHSPTRAVVLVTSQGSEIEPLTPIEIRRLFLGIPVYQDGNRLVPFLNTTDRLLYEVFLQKAMYLSASNYETQLVRRVFQFGGTRPSVAQNKTEVRTQLLSDKPHVGFMWAEDAQADSSIRIIQTLWRGEIR